MRSNPEVVQVADGTTDYRRASGKRHRVICKNNRSKEPEPTAWTHVLRTNALITVLYREFGDATQDFYQFVQVMPWSYAVLWLVTTVWAHVGVLLAVWT